MTKIDPNLPHTQAIVLVDNRKQAQAVETQLTAMGKELGITVLSLSHAYSQAGLQATDARDSIDAGNGPHIAIAPPYSAFNTAEQAPAWRETCRQHINCLVFDHFDEIAKDKEMLGFSEELMRDLAGRKSKKRVQTVAYICENEASEVSLNSAKNIFDLKKYKDPLGVFEVRATIKAHNNLILQQTGRKAGKSGAGPGAPREAVKEDVKRPPSTTNTHQSNAVVAPGLQIGGQTTNQINGIMTALGQVITALEPLRQATAPPPNQSQ